MRGRRHACVGAAAATKRRTLPPPVTLPPNSGGTHCKLRRSSQRAQHCFSCCTCSGEVFVNCGMHTSFVRDV